MTARKTNKLPRSKKDLAAYAGVSVDMIEELMNAAEKGDAMNLYGTRQNADSHGDIWFIGPVEGYGRQTDRASRARGTGATRAEAILDAINKELKVN